MLKETETEETIVFFVTFLSLAAIQLGEGGGGTPALSLSTPMCSLDIVNIAKNLDENVR